MPFFASAQQVAKSLKAANGVTIGFYEYKPADYSTFNGKYPVIIFLHGVGERGNGTTELSLVKNVAIPRYIDRGHKMKFTFNGKTESFMVLSPQLSKNYGDWQPFYVEEMIKHALKDPKVDPNRIILTGLSLGGGGVWQYASASATNASKLAAIAPICGTCKMTNATNITSTNLPVWAFHAKNDNVVGAYCTINAINSLNSKNPVVAPIYTEYPVGGHSIWDVAFDTVYKKQNPNIWEWFLGQNKALNANKVPVASAGSDASITLSTTSVTLRGSASDVDGNIVRTVWRKIGGPAGSGLLTDSLMPVVSLGGITVGGIYSYELTGVDNRGSWKRDTVNVNVAAALPLPTANKAPVANAGNNQAIYLPRNWVILSGSNSTDADGSIASYSWTQTSGPSTSTIASASSTSTKITDLIQGNYTFKLTVTDNRGSTATDDVTIVVYPGANAAPIAKAGNDITITLPMNSVTLDGELSTDSDGSIASYSWSMLSGHGAPSFSNPESKSTTISDLVEGIYNFRLTVYDNKNASSSDDVIVTVKAASINGVPTANAGDDQTITLPTSAVTLNASSSTDADGSIVSYAWSKIDGPLSYAISDATSAVVDVTELTEGSYTFAVSVTDDKNNVSIDSVVVTVNPAIVINNKLPIARLGFYKTTIKQPASSVFANGIGSSDPDGRIVSYKWEKISGPSSFYIAAPSAPYTQITRLVLGVYVFRFTVTDDQGGTASRDVEVTVVSSTVSQSSAKLSVKEVVAEATVTQNKLTVYPNPAISSFTVNLSAKENGKTTMNVYDVSGRNVQKMVIEKTYGTMNQQVDVSKLTPGIYHLEVIVDKGTRMISKFIKQ
jgi:poly(3-hydroxybutyrate) depolymerase